MAFLPPPSFEIPRPPIEPPLHGLLDAAYTPEGVADPDWENGIVFNPNPQTCGHVQPWQAWTDDPEDKAAPGTNIPYSTYHSFILTYSTHCHALPEAMKDEIDTAKRALEVGTGQAVEAIFWGPGDDGPLSELFPPLGDNFTLSGSTPLVTGSVAGSCNGILNEFATGEDITSYTPKQALLALTQSLANCALGARGFIHAPIYIVEDWAEQGLIRLSDPMDPKSTYITNVRGDYVVGGSGYSGVGPQDHPLETPADGFAWAYASGPVGVLLSEPRTKETTLVDHTSNLHKIIVERTVAIAANDTCLFAAYVDAA